MSSSSVGFAAKGSVLEEMLCTYAEGSLRRPHVSIPPGFSYLSLLLVAFLYDRRPNKSDGATSASDSISSEQLLACIGPDLPNSKGSTSPPRMDSTYADMSYYVQNFLRLHALSFEDPESSHQLSSPRVRGITRLVHDRHPEVITNILSLFNATGLLNTCSISVGVIGKPGKSDSEFQRAVTFSQVFRLPLRVWVGRRRCAGDAMEHNSWLRLPDIN
jgi:hypothetical protein